MTTRYLMPDDSTESIQQALQDVAELVQQATEPVDEVVLFVPVMDHLKSTTLSAVLGDEQAKLLKSGKPVMFNRVTSLRAIAERSFRGPQGSTILVVVYADQSMMDKVDTAPQFSVVIALPHAPDALRKWQHAWSPRMHGAGAPAAKSQIEDPVVEKAMEELTRIVNLSNGILGGSDQRHVDEILRTLRVLEHHREDASNLRAWAVGHFWKPAVADELEKLARRIFALKSKPNGMDNEQVARRKARWT